MESILFVDDMQEVYDKTIEALGNKYDFDWRNNPLDALKAIEGNVAKYGVAIFDVNLSYDPSKKNTEQETEGLDLIKKLRIKIDTEKIYLPIFCISSQNYKIQSLEHGANEFMWKKEFWEGKGEQKIEEYLKANI